MFLDRTGPTPGKVSSASEHSENEPLTNVPGFAGAPAVPEAQSRPQQSGPNPGSDPAGSACIQTERQSEPPDPCPADSQPRLPGRETAALEPRMKYS